MAKRHDKNVGNPTQDLSQQEAINHAYPVVDSSWQTFGATVWCG